jgi:hypothetical protein
VSALLGFCFPFGVRLVSPLARDALPWMWAGIAVNLLIGAASYFLLVVPARALGRPAVPTPARGEASPVIYARKPRSKSGVVQ